MLYSLVCVPFNSVDKNEKYTIYHQRKSQKEINPRNIMDEAAASAAAAASKKKKKKKNKKSHTSKVDDQKTVTASKRSKHHRNEKTMRSKSKDRDRSPSSLKKQKKCQDKTIITKTVDSFTTPTKEKKTKSNTPTTASTISSKESRESLATVSSKTSETSAVRKRLSTRLTLNDKKSPKNKKPGSSKQDTDPKELITKKKYGAKDNCNYEAKEFQCLAEKQVNDVLRVNLKMKTSEIKTMSLNQKHSVLIDKFQLKALGFAFPYICAEAGVDSRPVKMDKIFSSKNKAKPYLMKLLSNKMLQDATPEVIDLSKKEPKGSG